MSTDEDAAESIARLEARVAELEARHTGPDPASREGATGQPRGRRWRAILAVVLILVGTALAPVAVVATWAQATIFDTEGFVATYRPVVRDPGVQAYVRDEVVAAIDATIDIDGIVGDAVDGLKGVVGDRPRAAAALSLLARPAADAVRATITRATDRVVTSEAFAGAWEQSLRFTHSQLTGALAGDRAAAAAITADGLGLRLGPIVDRVRTTLIDQGFVLATVIPDIDRTVVVVRNPDLAQLKVWYRFAAAVGYWLPPVSAAFLVTGVLVARRRRAAMLGAALAVAAVAGGLVAGIALVGGMLPVLVPASVMPTGVARTLYETTTTVLHDLALAAFALGLSVALIGWWLGPSSSATWLRDGWDEAAAVFVRGREAHGLGTGRFGAWLRGQRVWIGAAVALVAALALAANRPLSAAGVVGTALASIAALVVARLLESSLEARVTD